MDAKTVNGMNGYEIVYTFSQGTMDVKKKQVLTEKNRIGFTLTYAASPETYETYISAFEQSVNSFTIV